MTVEKEMLVERYIRAYHKQTEQLAFEIKLPSNALTFLSMVDFLQDEIDPLLYGITELDADQTDYIHRHFFVDNIADPDYFDYFLECDSLPTSKVKTKEEFFESNLISTLEDELSFLVHDVSGFSDRRVPKHSLNNIKELAYKIYQQGVQDGRL